MLDGRLQGAAPLVPLEVSAGRHFIAILDHGVYPFARELDLEIGEEVKLVAELKSTQQRTIAYVLLGFAGAFLAGTSVGRNSFGGLLRYPLDPLTRSLKLV